jgi:protease-4
MQYAGFFSELYESPLVVTETGLNKYLPYIIAHQKGELIDFPELPALEMSYYDSASLQQLTEGEEKRNAVAVIPCYGMMTRSGSWWDYGADEYAAMLNQAYADESIKSIVVRMRCVGGGVDSSFPLKEAMAKRNKKVFFAVDSYAYSMGYYWAALGDGIFPVGEMASMGSIGVYATLRDNKKMLEQYGIKVLEIIPPESKWKNRTTREALKGKNELLITEELTPWAVHFQNIVKENRPNLDESVEGILEGRTFFANDSVANGLANKIMSFEEIIDYAANHEEKRNNKISNFFNNN